MLGPFDDGPSERAMARAGRVAEWFLVGGLVFQIALVIVTELLALYLAPANPGLDLFADGVVTSSAALLAGIGAVIELVFVPLVLGRLRSGRFRGAESLTIVLAVVGTFFGFGLVGLLFVAAYVNIGRAEAHREESRVRGAETPLAPSIAPAGPPRLAPGTAPQPPPVPVFAAMPPPPVASPFCPRCRRSTGWVPQYSRYFCYGCNQYL